ncbi:MAG TPA: DinB family protein [Thermoanaerobaculia bacterium]
MTYDFLLDTYETERLKTVSVWSAFTDDDIEFRPAPRIRTPHEHMVHQCISEDNWMKNMLGIETAMPQLPSPETRIEFMRHYAAASAKRLELLREKTDEWWTEAGAFFETQRTRAWIMLRRLTHSSHHRAQLTVYLRLLGRPVYSTYGPSADTGGLPLNKAPTIYRYENIADLLNAEQKGGRFPHLPGPGEKSPTERPGTAQVRRSFDRVPVRVRGSNTTQAAWRVVADSANGSGSITLLDDGSFRGEGIFFDWPQAQLAAEYQRLNPPSDEPPFVVPQLG